MSLMASLLALPSNGVGLTIKHFRSKNIHQPSCNAERSGAKDGCMFMFDFGIHYRTHINIGVGSYFTRPFALLGTEPAGAPIYV
jgi:hypothetical protein